MKHLVVYPNGTTNVLADGYRPVVTHETLSEERLFAKYHQHLVKLGQPDLSWRARAAARIHDRCGHGVDMHSHEVY